MYTLAIFEERKGRKHFKRNVRIPGKLGRELAERNDKILTQMREEQRKELLKQNH